MRSSSFFIITGASRQGNNAMDAAIDQASLTELLRPGGVLEGLTLSQFSKATKAAKQALKDRNICQLIKIITPQKFIGMTDLAFKALQNPTIQQLILCRQLPFDKLVAEADQILLCIENDEIKRKILSNVKQQQEDLTTLLEQQLLLLQDKRVVSWLAYIQDQLRFLFDNQFTGLDGYIDTLPPPVLQNIPAPQQQLSSECLSQSSNTFFNSNKPSTSDTTPVETLDMILKRKIDAVDVQEWVQSYGFSQ